MIRRVAMGVMVACLVFLVVGFFFEKPQLVGNAIATPCTDSDLKETNDLLNGELFSRDRFSTLNYALQGTTRGVHSVLKIPVTMKDHCLAPAKLTEYFCDLRKNVVAYASVRCPAASRCYDGACVSLVCEDTDGFNVMKKSNIRYTSADGSKLLSASDYCESSTTVVEFVCQGTDVVWPSGIQNSYDYPEDLRTAVHSTCPTGTSCKKGACVRS